MLYFSLVVPAVLIVLHALCVFYASWQVNDDDDVDYRPRSYRRYNTHMAYTKACVENGNYDATTHVRKLSLIRV